jgi:hypothetical protein
MGGPVTNLDDPQAVAAEPRRLGHRVYDPHMAGVHDGPQQVALPDGWVRDPLPEGLTTIEVSPEPCGTCGSADLTRIDGQWGPVARTARPDPRTGLYMVQAHHEWCPVWTGQLEELACPTCSAPVHDYESRPGYSFLVIDDETGVMRTTAGTVDEVLADLNVRLTHEAPPAREPQFDKLKLGPCGHVLVGCDAHRMIGRIAHVRARRHRAEADAAIAANQHLLTAAEQAGHEPLAHAYRHAVHAGLRTASGLLKALQLLHDETAS